MSGATVRAEREALAGALAGELRYSRVWEDHLLLERGLGVGPADELVMIASAGCNVFNLLLREPRRIVAVDLNPAQTALVQLKLAGIRELDRRGFMELLGLSPGDPVARYERIRGTLPESAKAWWDGNVALLAAGVERAGRLDRFLAGFKREHLERIHAPATVDRLFRIENRAERARFAREELFTPAFERAFRDYFTLEALDARGRDPAQSRHVREPDVPGRFFERLVRACTEMPVRGNFHLERFLRGDDAEPRWHPPYLVPDGYARLRGLVQRVGVETGELEEYLAGQPDGCFTSAALSDVFEYLSPSGSESLFATLARSLSAGGRIAYWNLLVPCESPPALRRRLRHLDRLSRALSRRDRAWFYRAFHIEEVLRS